MKLSAHNLENKIITESTLNTVKEISAVNHMDIFTLLGHKAVSVVYVDGEKTEVKQCLVVKMDSGAVYLWEGNTFYETDSDDIFYDNYNEALSVAEHLDHKPKFWCLKANANSEIWNVILQKWDKTGEEVEHSVTSFTSREAAIAKYYEWLGWDKADKHVSDLEETEGRLEYYWNRGDELHRCLVVESRLFNE